MTVKMCICCGIAVCFFWQQSPGRAFQFLHPQMANVISEVGKEVVEFGHDAALTVVDYIRDSWEIPRRNAKGNHATCAARVTFTFYEVGKDGRPTVDSPYRVIGLKTLPNLAQLKPGSVLVAASGESHLRCGPAEQSDAIGIVEMGHCVRVTAIAQTVRTEEARSGGWLQVVRTKCQQK